MSSLKVQSRAPLDSQKSTAQPQDFPLLQPGRGAADPCAQTSAEPGKTDQPRSPQEDAETSLGVIPAPEGPHADSPSRISAARSVIASPRRAAREVRVPNAIPVVYCSLARAV